MARRLSKSETGKGGRFSKTKSSARAKSFKSSRSQASISAGTKLGTGVSIKISTATAGRTPQVLAATRQVEGGGRVTVTRSGKVTQVGVKTPQNPTGRRLQFQASRQMARNFLRESAITEAQSKAFAQAKLKAKQERLNRIKRQNLALAEAIKKGKKKKMTKKGVIFTTAEVDSRAKALRGKPTKGVAGALARLEVVKQEQLTKIGKTTAGKEGAGERIFRGTVVLGSVGAARGFLGIAQAVTNPIDTAKGFVQAVKNPIVTIRGIKDQFVVDPVGTVAEFYVWSKSMNAVSKAGARSGLGQLVKEKLYIATLPKQLRSPINTLFKANRVQRAINPKGLTKPTKVNFAQVKSLSKTEAIAIGKTLKQTDSIVFGSLASKTLGKVKGRKSKLPTPKDVDLATSNIKGFNQQFIKNIPKKQRANYIVRGEKLIRKSNGQALYDIKPINRLFPDRSLLTRRGFLPVAGFVTRLKSVKGSILPRPKKVLAQGRLEVKTGKPVKVAGVKLIGFSEQTTRKALGTIQVLVEKNVRRAKDPQGLLESLQIQRQVLVNIKPKTFIGKARKKNKIKALDNAIKLMTSKSFTNLLKKKVPGINKKFPLLKRLPIGKLNKIKKLATEKIKNKIATAIRRKVKPAALKKRTGGTIRAKKRISPKKKISSRLPKKKVSRLPSKLPKKRVSKLPVIERPSKIPASKQPSRLATSSLVPKPSPVPKSAIPKSKVPKSKTPKSKTPTSKTPGSKTPISSVPPSKPPVSKIPGKPKSKTPVSKLPKRAKIGKTVKGLPQLRDKRGRLIPYNVYIRRQGAKKFTKANNKPLNRDDARRLGRFIADNTPRASFEVRRAAKKIGQKFKKSTPLKKFRAIKGKSKLPNVAKVERSKFRLDTKGEKQGITAKGLAKLRTQGAIVRALTPKRKKKVIKRGRKRVKK